MERVHTASEKKKNQKWFAVLCLAGLLINFLGDRLVGALHLPLYLDNIGSALAAALGGYIPGIIVGFFTNLINGFRSVDNTYYGSLTVLIAISSAFFAERGDYGRIRKLPLIILVFTLIGGGIGSVLTWVMNSFQIGNDLTAPLARQIHAGGVLSPFLSQVSASLLIDLGDKTITVLVVALALKCIPESVKRVFGGWALRIKPLRVWQRESQATHRKSLRRKIILLVALSIVVTAGAVTTISYINFINASIDEQKDLARGVVDVVKGTFDADRVDEYIEKGEAAEGYLEAETIMSSLMESSQFIEYCYVYRILDDGCQVVFDPDTEELKGEDPGTIIPIEDAFRDLLPDLHAGREIEPVISNDTYGWLLTIYSPVYDRAGVCQCYAAVDITMDHIARNGYEFLAKVLSLFFGFFVLILTAVIWMAEYNVIIPINSMAVQANISDYSTEESRERTVEGIESLQIHTGDEIENLYTAMVNSSRDMSSTAEAMSRMIAQTQKQGDEIRKLQNGLILVLADMVESRDQNTGEHVRKTAAYTGAVMRQLRREHIYEDQLTDAFIEDVMNSAPLHDVGKIQVSDNILNKPGKLTAEEFEIMKTHTTAGAQIISSAIDMVSEEDSGYLKEARNLAKYHHEKWNGTGYPEGLKGEEIPLSARVMAVADVFDALVSKRSYKEGFPFEKAMAIIQEGSGSHFDPNVAQAFLHAEKEVRQIMETQMSR